MNRIFWVNIGYSTHSLGLHCEQKYGVEHLEELTHFKKQQLKLRKCISGRFVGQHREAEAEDASERRIKRL